MLHGNNEDDEPVNDMFQEPEGFYEDEKQPTFDRFTLRSGDEVNLRLVGHNPLWVRDQSSSAHSTRAPPIPV